MLPKRKGVIALDTNGQLGLVRFSTLAMAPKGPIKEKLSMLLVIPEGHIWVYIRSVASQFVGSRWTGMETGSIFYKRKLSKVVFMFFTKDKINWHCTEELASKVFVKLAQLSFVTEVCTLDFSVLSFLSKCIFEASLQIGKSEKATKAVLLLQSRQTSSRPDYR